MRDLLRGIPFLRYGLLEKCGAVLYNNKEIKHKGIKTGERGTENSICRCSGSADDRGAGLFYDAGAERACGEKGQEDRDRRAG